MTKKIEVSCSQCAEFGHSAMCGNTADALLEAAQEAQHVLDALFEFGHETSRIKSMALIPRSKLKAALTAAQGGSL